MIKTYLSEKGISMYKLSQLSGVPYSTVNDLVNHKTLIDNMKGKQIRAIADVLEISMNDLYDMCEFSKPVKISENGYVAEVTVEQKEFVLKVTDLDGKVHKEPIIKVKSEASRFIDTLAKWKFEEVLENMKLEEAYEALQLKS